MAAKRQGFMRPIWTVYKREIRTYLQTPATYVALALFFLLTGALFTLVVGDFVDASVKAQAGAPTDPNAVPVSLNITEGVITQVFLAVNFVLLFILPLLTMRLIAEEKKSGTFELLVSTPLSNWAILLGKYLSAMTIGVFILAVSLLYPAICAFYSHPEGSVVASCFIGLFLVLAAYTAFGLFASALSDSQIVAGVLSFVGLLIFYVVGMLFKAGWLGMAGSALSIKQHSESFMRGVVASGDVAFFALFTFFFLYMAAQILDMRRWRA